MKRSGFKRKSGKPLKRTKIRVKGVSTTAELKDEIQAILRKIVIERDGGCILRNVRHCADPVLQADHLITRGNSATYADPRLVVCLCRTCHGWKSLGGNLRKKQHDSLVRTLLPKDRVALWDRCEEESWRPTPKRSYDWKLAIVALKQEAKKLGITTL